MDQEQIGIVGSERVCPVDEYTLKFEVGIELLIRVPEYR
jgi:hypothetical protein